MDRPDVTPSRSTQAKPNYFPLIILSFIIGTIPAAIYGYLNFNITGLVIGLIAGSPAVLVVFILLRILYELYKYTFNPVVAHCPDCKSALRFKQDYKCTECGKDHPDKFRCY